MPMWIRRYLLGAALLCIGLALSGCLLFGSGVVDRSGNAIGSLYVLESTGGLRLEIVPEPGSTVYLGYPGSGDYVPMPFTRVSVAGTGIDADTDTNGVFRLYGVPSGGRELIVHGDYGQEIARFPFHQSPSTTVVLGTLPTEKDWTIMVYMMADNNLDQAMINDIHEMEQVGSSDRVNVVAYADAYGFWDQLYPHSDDPPAYRGAKILEIRDVSVHGFSPVVSYPRDGEDQFQVTMDTEALRGFVEFSKLRYPAHRYALIIWNHGDGITIHNPGSLLTEPPGSTLAIGPDMNSGSGEFWLEVPNIRYALAGLDLDVVAFDACLMGGIEVFYELAGVADVVVGSAEVVPLRGNDYTALLQGLVSNPSIGAMGLALEMLHSYAGYYSPMDAAQLGVELSLTAVESSGVSQLVSLLADLISTLLNHMDDVVYGGMVEAAVEDSLAIAHRYADIIGYHAYWFRDLEDFCWGLRASSLSTLPLHIREMIVARVDSVLEYLQYMESHGRLAVATIPSGVRSDPSVRLEIWPSFSSRISLFAQPGWLWDTIGPAYGSNYGYSAFAERSRWDQVLERLGPGTR